MADAVDKRGQALDAARRALKQDRPRWAAVGLREWLAIADDDAEAWELLAVAHAMLHEDDAARNGFERAVELAPGRATAHYNYALHLAAMGALDEAGEHNSAALYLAPEHHGARTLQQQISVRIRDRLRTSEAGFAVTANRVDPIHEPSREWARIPCASCGGMNFITARTCARCGSLLPEMDPIVPVE